MEELWRLFLVWCEKNPGHWQIILQADGRGWLRDGGDLNTPIFRWYSIESGIQEFNDWLEDDETP